VYLPRDLGTWGFILSLATIVLMYPVGLLINMTTPIVQNWVATRTKQSLVKRIERLENELAELEKIPPIDEVQDYVLWGLTAIRILIIEVTSTLTALLYLAVRVLSAGTGRTIDDFTYFAVFVMISSAVLQLRLRYSHDFRRARSPRRREGLRTEIDDLKKIRDSWQ
jgi:hypothetical protein